MRPLNHPFFLLSVLTYAFVKASAWQGNHWPFIHTQLADLLCMPIVLGIALFLMRKIKAKPAFVLNATQIIFTVAFYSLLFELLFPLISERQKGDFWDVIAYAIGAVAFHFILNRSNHMPAPGTKGRSE